MEGTTVARAHEQSLPAPQRWAEGVACCGLWRFVLISSDKAVEPTSVMGATKRLAEMYAGSAPAGSRGADRPTGDGMVRFGNAGCGACSVLPI